MATEIQTWEIINGSLNAIDTSLSQHKLREQQDLEQWITTNPQILGLDITIIGRQVMTKSGPLDFIGIDSDGNSVIIELKRDKLPREVIAQAIDYASDVSTWDIEKLGNICREYHSQELEDVLAENFDHINIDDIVINSSQRLLLVGFGIDERLSRMIEWLSTNYNLAINAILLNYSRTSAGNEVLSRTVIIPEEIEKTKTNKKKFKVPMSDEPGTYDNLELKQKLKQYLGGKLHSARRIKDVVLPILLRNENTTREELKQGFVASGEVGESKSWNFMSLISQQLGHEWKDYLRQVISYSYPNNHWEKDNFRIVDEYRGLIEEVLSELSTNE